MLTNVPPRAWHGLLYYRHIINACLQEQNIPGRGRVMLAGLPVREQNYVTPERLVNPLHRSGLGHSGALLAPSVLYLPSCASFYTLTLTRGVSGLRASAMGQSHWVPRSSFLTTVNPPSSLPAPPSLLPPPSSLPPHPSSLPPSPSASITQPLPGILCPQVTTQI